MVKQRNPAIVVLLTIVTFGIYGMVATYLMAKEADAVTGSTAKRPAGVAITLHVLGLLTVLALPIVMIAVLAASAGALFTDGIEAADGAATNGLGVVLVMLASYLILLFGAGILYTGAHARIQKAAKGGGTAAWVLGVFATLFLVGSWAYVFPAVPDWVMFLGTLGVLLVPVMVAMSASSLNALADGGAGAGAPAGADAAW